MSIQIAFIRDAMHKNGPAMHRIVQRPKMSFDQLIKYMERTTGLSGTDFKSMFGHFVEALVFLLPDGRLVETPVGTFCIGLDTGTAASKAKGRRPCVGIVNSRSVVIRLRPDKSMIARVQRAASFKTVDAPHVKLPRIALVENIEAPAAPNEGSPDQILHIMGHRLSFTVDNTALGVFFIDTLAQTETRANTYSRVGTTHINCKIPVVPSGSYSIEVRTSPNGTYISKATAEAAFIVR